MLKVLFVLQDSYVNKTAGIELYTHNLAKHISTKEIKASIVAKGEKNFAERLQFDDLEYNLVSKTKNNIINSILFPFKLASVIKKINPDVIHGVTFFPIGFYCLIYKYIFRKPTLVHVHASDVYLLNSWVMYIFGKIIIKNNTSIVGITSHVCQVLIEKSGCSPPLLNIPISTNYELNLISRNNCKKRILFVGNFRPLKGIRKLIRVLYILRKIDSDYNLTIVGGAKTNLSKSYKEKCVNDAKALEVLDYIEFTGSLDSKEMKKYYTNSDILAIMSLSEGFPQTILEAAANNLPVVSTSVGGIPEFLPEFCLSNGKTSDFATKIHKICINKKLRGKAIQTNRDSLLNDYSFAQTSEQFRKIYREEINA